MNGNKHTSSAVIIFFKLADKKRYSHPLAIDPLALLKGFELTAKVVTNSRKERFFTIFSTATCP
jgi:hypothetical protein